MHAHPATARGRTARPQQRESDPGCSSSARPVLEHHIATGLHRRVGAAPSNFADHLDPVDAAQAQEMVNNPYVFDFLDLLERSCER